MTGSIKVAARSIVRNRVRSLAPKIVQLLIVVPVAVSVAAAGQEPAKQEAATIKSVEITPARIEAQVGQQVKFIAVARDAAGKAIEVKQVYWFAGPFDLAAADDSGNV